MRGEVFGDKGYGKQGDILISMQDDLLMVEVSRVHPAGESMRGKASKHAAAAATARNKAKRRDHAKDGTPAYHSASKSMGDSAGKLTSYLKTWPTRQQVQGFGKEMCSYIGSGQKSL
jgi:hypothetical protein